MESLNPQVVVVNNGPRKGADPETMKVLLSLPYVETIWQLHRNVREGASNTLREYIANVNPDCSAEYLKASIRPDGHFSIQIGENGKRKQYLAR